jgi:hypothetical protein
MMLFFCRNLGLIPREINYLYSRAELDRMEMDENSHRDKLTIFLRKDKLSQPFSHSKQDGLG